MYILVKIASILSALLLFISGLFGSNTIYSLNVSGSSVVDSKGNTVYEDCADIESVTLDDGQEILVIQTRNTAPTAEEREMCSEYLVTVLAKSGKWAVSGRYTGFAGASENRILLYTADVSGEKIVAFDYSGNKVFELGGASKINNFSASLAVVSEFDLETLLGKSYYVNLSGEKVTEDFSVCTDFNECGFAVVYLHDGSCGVLGADGRFVVSPTYDFITLEGNTATAEIGEESCTILLD